MPHFYEEAVKHEELMTTLTSTYNLTAELFAARLAEISARREAGRRDRRLIAHSPLANPGMPAGVSVS